MAFLTVVNTESGVTGWPQGQTRYWTYADSLTCEQAQAQFLALTAAQQLAQSTTTEPTIPTGKIKQNRNCSVPTTPGGNSLPVTGNYPFQARFTFNPTLSEIFIEVDPTDDTQSFQTKIRRKDSQPFKMGNAQNALLNSDTFYGAGPGNQPWIQQFRYGKAQSGEGGIVPNVPYIITFFWGNNQTLDVNYTPPNQLVSNQSMVVGNGATTVEDYTLVGLPYDDADYTPGSGNGGTYGATTFLAGNSDIFSPIIEWQNGKARVKNGVSPSIPPGHNLYYFVDGQGWQSALSTEYVLLPGDEVSIYLAITTGLETFFHPYNIKGSAHIYIGNPPA